MLTTFGLLSLLVGSVAGPAHQPAAVSSRPRVEIWTDRGDDPYARGQGVRVHFRTEQDAYVTILRIDTDGRVRMLFPREPWEDNFARGDRDYEVPGRDSRDAFYIDDSPGVGYIFAVVAGDAFVYDALENHDHWDYRATSDGRVHGDPYVAVTDLAERIVPAGYGDWDYDLAPYYVQRHSDYPRFLCYDCDAQDRALPRERARRPGPPAQPEPRARAAQPDRGARSERPERREPPVRRAEPRREAPPPKSEPRVEPKRDPPKDKPRSEP